MHNKTLTVLAGVGGSLLLATSAEAAFTGLSVETKDNGFGFVVCNVYACFDNAGDHMIAVAGTPDTPASISVNGGAFYNNTFQTPGGKAPNSAFIALFPSLEFDTFITIGRKTDDAVTGTTPGFPDIDAADGSLSSFGGTNLSWFITVDDAQGTPDADGKVLIGQFTSDTAGAVISGEFLIQARNDGDPFFQQAVSFAHVPAPGALAVLGLAGLVGSRRRRG